MEQPTFWGRVAAGAAGIVLLALIGAFMVTGTYREKVDNTEKRVEKMEAELKELRDLTKATQALQVQQSEWNKIVMDHIVSEAKNGRNR